MSLESRLQELTFAAENPGALLKQYKKDRRSVIGCFPVYVPEELVFAAGAVPMGLWGAQTDLSKAKQFLPAFACSIMQSCLELGLNEAYDGLNAVIIPSMCDTFKNMIHNWRLGVKNIPVIAFAHPQNRQSPAAMRYLEREYLLVKEKLEVYCGNPIVDSKIQAAIAVYNEHSQVMQEFAQVAVDHLDIIDPIVRHNVFKSGWFMEKPAHTAAVREVVEELKKLPKHEWKGKRAVLTGILAEPAELLQILKDNNIAVVADDLGQESQQYRTLIPDRGDNGIQRLCYQWQDRRGSSLAFEEHKTRGEMLVQMCKDTAADAVIVCMMKFCDPEEYDYPVYMHSLNEAGIPSLYLEIDQQTDNNEQARTRIQSFAEML